MSITVIAGLGNPGDEYRDTRHNIGFVVIDALAADLGATWALDKKRKGWFAEVSYRGRKLHLVKPNTYMNDSGKCLGPFARFLKIKPENVTVLYDELTLDLGRVKLSERGGAGGHNGVTDLLQHLGNGFIRYRIGIGAKPNPQMDLKDYVLSRFSTEEQALLTAKHSNYVADLRYLLDRGVVHAMNHINRKSKTDEHTDTQHL